MLWSGSYCSSGADYFVCMRVPFSDDEFTWQCSEGHWNKESELSCRQCHEAKPERPDVLRDLLEKIAKEHPRKEEK